MNRRFGIAAAVCLALGITAAGSAPAAVAQTEAAGSSYITPFPEGDIYRTVVVGDAYAEGVLAGLIDAFGSDSRLQIARKHRSFAGIARADIDDELKSVEEFLTREPSHITIVMIGRDDRSPIRAGNKRLQVGREDWREEYGKRVDRLMKAMKQRGGAIYWVGLPGVRRQDWSEDIVSLNDVLRDRAYLNGIKFIDAFAGFADEGGNFIVDGPDASGRMRVMRSPDGIGFTEAGNRKLAHFIEREIRRDLTQAKNERAIPLAGAEPEQRKINPAKAASEAAPPVTAAAAGPKAAESKSSWATTTGAAPQPSPPAVAAAPDQKADNSRITLRSPLPGGREETVTLDIFRPAIPASVIQLLSRNATAERGTQIGETLQDNLPGGLIILSSVSPAGDGANGRRSKVAPTQTPYFRVMVKGERLPSKPDRADDFRWPRPDLADPEPTAAAGGVAAQPAAANSVRQPASKPARP